MKDIKILSDKTRVFEQKRRLLLYLLEEEGFEVSQRQTTSPSRSSLVRIQSVGSNRPFFCVHPAGGSVICYIDLARFLGLEQPFYGLQASGLDGQQEPYTQIEDMAAHYTEALRVVQPEGPYFLGGWSMGGIVAFEMAQQLQAQGQKIALLALIDTVATTSGAQAEDEDEVVLLGNFAQNLGLWWEHLEFSLDSFLQLNLDERLAYVLRQA